MEKTWYQKVLEIGMSLSPVITTVAGIVLPGSSVIVKALGAIPALVSAAEAIFGEKKGEEKMAFVLEGVEKTARTMADLSTGGQKETWEHLSNLAKPIATAVVVGANTFDDPSIDSVTVGISEVAKAACETVKEFGWEDFVGRG